MASLLDDVLAYPLVDVQRRHQLSRIDQNTYAILQGLAELAASGIGGSNPMTITDLNGGTALAVNNSYFDTVSADRALDALPTGGNGDTILFTFDVTGAPRNISFASTVYRTGRVGALAGPILFPVGNHSLRLYKTDGKWWLSDSALGLIEVIVVALGDEVTDITTGNAKVTIRAPYAFNILSVRASLSTASSSGIPTIDINEGGVTILSTKLTIDANEKTSTTAAVAAVISDAAIADDAEITFDIDVAGTGARGPKVEIYHVRA